MIFSRKVALIAAPVTIALGAFLGSCGQWGANAAVSTVTAATQVSNHPDTTNPTGSGTACTSSPNGPVWAADAYASQLTAVQTGTGTWRVTIQDNGTFAGFADPVTCDALTSNGSLIGLYTVTVTSAKTPSQGTLKSAYSGAVSTTHMVEDFFGDPSAVVTGGDYFFSYQGGAYVQTTSSIYGDVTAAAPPPPPPAHPSGANALPGSFSATPYQTSVNLGWGASPTAHPGVTAYHYQIDTLAGVVVCDGRTTTTHASCIGLHSGTAYEWRVATGQDAWHFASPWSAFRRVTTR